MKKFLLLAVAAIVALTANARQLNVEKSMKLRTLSETMAPSMKAMDPAAAPAAARPISRAAGDVLEFVEVSVDWLNDKDETEINSCAGVSVVKSGQTASYNGEKMEKVTVVGICSGAATVEGYMSNSKLIIPSQVCQMDASTTSQYGEIILMSYRVNEAGTAIEKSDADIVFENDGNGFYSVNDERYYGVVLQMTGNYSQYIWTAAYFAQLAKANGQLNMRQSRGSWESVTAPVYVELGENGKVTVYNAYNAAAATMYIQQDNTVLIPTMQIMAATSSSIDQAAYGYAYRLLYVGVTEDGNLSVDEAAEYIPAVLTDEKTIAYAPGVYSGIFSNFDGDGRAYYMGYQTQVTFTLNEGSFVPSSGTEDNDSTDVNPSTDVIYMNDITAKVGDVVDIDILMNNTKEVCGYQFDLYLPYGMELVANGNDLVSRGSRTTSTHTLSSAARSDFYRVLSYSTNNKPYAGNEGDIVKLQVRLTAQMTADSATIEIRNAVLSCTDASTIYCADTKATVKVDREQIIRGDANDDGKVNVGDITAIVNNILYDGTINEGVADVNNDSKINVSDISWIAHFIMTGKFYDEDGTLSNVQNAGFSASLSMTDAVMQTGSGCDFVISLLAGNADVTGIQFDLRLPAGLSLNGDAQQNTLRVNDHVLQWTALADDVYRFLVYSASNGTIARGESAIITLPIAAAATMTPGQYEVSIENVVMTNGAFSVAEAVTTASVSVEDPTAISSIEAAQSSQIYDLTGRQLKQAQKGVNIINGVKVLK